MFDKDTKLIYEAYEVQKVNEGKMKDIVTAIEAGDDVDEIISSLKLNDTEEVRAMITKARDNFYEQGERGEDAENCPMSGEEVEDAENCSMSDEEGDVSQEDAEVEETAEDSESVDLHDEFYELIKSGKREEAKEVLDKLEKINPETASHLKKVYDDEDEELEPYTKHYMHF